MDGKELIGGGRGGVGLSGEFIWKEDGFGYWEGIGVEFGRSVWVRNWLMG